MITNWYEVRYVNECHRTANKHIKNKLQVGYLAADNFLDAVALAHSNIPENHILFSVTLEQRNATVIVP